MPVPAVNDVARQRRVVLALALIVGVAAVVRVWGLAFGLPHTQARPDETHIIEAARTILSGKLPRFYDYPWLYIFSLSLLYLGYFAWGVVTGAFHSVAEMVASWPTYWAPFFLLSRLMAAAYGTLTVLVVFRIGRRLWDDTAGLLAALFLALAFIHARDSHFGTTDTALSFFIVCSVGLLIDAHRTRRPRRFALAGVVGGLGAATKYNAVLLIAPIVASYVLHVGLAADRVKAARDPRLFAYGLPFLAAFGVGIPFIVLDYPNFALAMRDLQSSMAIGDPRLGLTNGWVHHLVNSMRYGLGLPLLLAGGGGAVLLGLRTPGLAVLLLAFPVAYYSVAGGLRNLFFRYTIPIVPFLCLTAAYLVWQAGSWIGSRQPWVRRRAAVAAATAMLAAVVIGPSAISVWRFDRIVSERDNRVVVADWFAQHVPPGSSVLQSGSRYGLAQFHRSLGYREWVWDGGARIFRVAGRPATGEPDWIVVQDSPLPSSTQEFVTHILPKDYVLVTTFKAVSLRADLVYDRQDMFYVPFSGLEYVSRPGPNFALYARRDLAIHADLSTAVR
ncbi:MAG TPA: glycosyltransferase family 39 protein [Vicinamibacterales bacterium]|nr:glycosyltransferase family 39 protein [Vicinamibacterales bacterium]